MLEDPGGGRLISVGLNTGVAGQRRVAGSD